MSGDSLARHDVAPDDPDAVPVPVRRLECEIPAPGRSGQAKLALFAVAGDDVFRETVEREALLARVNLLGGKLRQPFFVLVEVVPRLRQCDDASTRSGEHVSAREPAGSGAVRWSPRIDC